MAYCNHGILQPRHNGKAGDIVWLSWCPDGRADDNKQFEWWMLTPCHGATMLMFSPCEVSTPKHKSHCLRVQLTWTSAT